MSLKSYKKPIMSFADNIHIKVGLALVFETLSNWGLGEVYHTLIQSPLKLIILIILLIFIDFITGIIKSYKKGEKLSSRRARDTIIKSLEYFFFLGSIILFANGFADQSDLIGFLADKLKAFAFFLVAIIEMNSIFENLSNKDITKAWIKIKDKFNFNLNSNEK